MKVKKCILIMEEDRNLRNLYSYLLGEEFVIVAVPDRFEAANIFALAKARGVSFDLVMVNLKSRTEPEAGFEAVRELRRIDEKAKVVLHSSAAGQYPLADLRSRGFAGRIQRCMDREQLLTLVRSFL